jgi:hypothetical protein
MTGVPLIGRTGRTYAATGNRVSLSASATQLTQLPGTKVLRALAISFIADFSVLGNRKNAIKNDDTLFHQRNGTTVLSGLMPNFGAPARMASTM